MTVENKTIKLSLVYTVFYNYSGILFHRKIFHITFV